MSTHVKLAGIGEATFTPQEAAERLYGDRTLALDTVYQLLRLEEQNELLRAELEKEGKRLDLAIQALGPLPETGSALGRAARKALPGLVFFVGGMVVLSLALVGLSEMIPGWCAGPGEAVVGMIR
ncbi:MAG TPA: hypothetical protein VF263_17265 [Longimicrobiaceae bacterium]